MMLFEHGKTVLTITVSPAVGTVMHFLVGKPFSEFELAEDVEIVYAELSGLVGRDWTVTFVAKNRTTETTQ